MSLFYLATKLEELDNERRRKLLLEATTMDAISFLPSQLGVVRDKIKSLAKLKRDWGIEILEDDQSKTLKIEDVLSIKVPKKYWEKFLSIFDGKLGNNTTCLDLGSIINETIEEELKDLREKLKPALVDMFNRHPFKDVDRLASLWRTWFRIESFRTRDNKGPLISYERKLKDIQRLVGDLLDEYGDDRGHLEMLLEDIKERDNLSTYEVFKSYDFLYGTRMQSRLEEIVLVFEALVDPTYNVIQSIYVGDDDVLDKIEEDIRSVKRVGKVLYPTGEGFTSSLFRQLREIIEEVVTPSS